MKQNYSWPGRYFKTLLSTFIVALSLVSTVFAQTYTNGNVGTGATSMNGTAAPAGTTWHELQSAGGVANTTLGVGHARSGTADFSLADDFVVPAGQTWNLSKLRIYLIDQVTAGTVSPYNDIRVKIYNGKPGAGGTVVFGNMTTNRFVATGYTAKRAIFNSGTGAAAPTPNLPVFYIDASVPFSLTAGTYWVEWSVVAPTVSFSLTSQVPGVRALPSYNAIQNSTATSGSTWTALVDAGAPASPAGIELPFDLTYTTTCTAADAPVLTSSSSTACAGTPVTISASGNLGNAANYSYYTGSCGGTLVGTGSSLTVSPTVTTTYYVRGDGAGACTPAPGACSQITITVTPCTCLSPDVANICEGVIQKLSVTGTGTTATVNGTSGSISVAIPDASAAGVLSPNLPITLPAGASINSIIVNMNITHTWDGDVSVNLIAPDGSVYNLVSGRGGSGEDFTNTNISTLSTVSFATGTPPFTGTFAPDYTLNAGPTAFPATIANFAAFNKMQATGNWRLGLRDVAAGDVGTLTSWSITINYSVLPTAIWTGGTFFTNAAATTPYVAGTEANTVWVTPAATTTYTATIAAGPCAGANTVTVTVLPRPVVTVSPLTSCGPSLLTATGATTYAWTPAGGLSATTGATVTANPNTTTTYTVVGTGANGCPAVPKTATVNAAPTASVIAAVAGSTFQINEGFATVPPAGWSRNNASAPAAASDWGQGTTAAGGAFDAFNGPANSYAFASYLATSATTGGIISNWLISPVINIKNGDIVSFYTRTETGGGIYNDGLQLRLSTAGASVNVGSGATVGDFTTVLTNVGQAAGGTYPETWTRYTATISGITGTVSGRIAFRHFVTGAGALGNGDYIGVDAVTYETPATVNCANVVTNIKVDITGGVGPYTVVYSNGTVNTIVNNYTSGSNIQVSPAATTTYTIVSVTGANGCVGTGNTGSATVTITPAAAITTQPLSVSVCEGNNATFTVAGTPAVGNTYQWQMALAATPTVFTNIAGATNTTYTVTAATVAMSGNNYRVVVAGACGAAVTSSVATLTVNTAAVITTQPSNASVCAAPSSTTGSSTFTVAATGGGLTYQWQVSNDNGTTYTNVANGVNYSGATTATLTVTAVPATFNNNRYRVLVTSGGCTAVTSGAATLTVNASPIVVITASPVTALFPGQTTTLTAAVSPNAATSYQWYQNGSPVTGATAATLVLGIDNLGTYYAEAGDGNSCRGRSNSITIRDSSSNVLFIYPSPTTGRFQVRYFVDLGTGMKAPGVVNVYDSKGARVYTQRYTVLSGYTRMDVDLSNQSKGIYMVDLLDVNGARIKTGRVVVQ